MRRLRQFTLVCLTLVFVFSCGSKVSTTTNNSADFTNYKSFAYLPNTNFETAENMGQIDQTVGESVIAALNDIMVSEGYNIDRTNPDMLVLLTTVYNSEFEREIEPNYAEFPATYNYPVSPYYSTVYYDRYKRYPIGLAYDVHYDTYQEGTLIIEFFDTESKALLWRGVAEEYLSNLSTQETIVEMVEDIFDEFPK